MLTYTDALARLYGVHESIPGRQATARCPVPSHPDRKASLSIGKAEDGQLLLFCHAGCAFREIVTALEAEPGELADMAESMGQEGASSSGAPPHRTRRRHPHEQGQRQNVVRRVYRYVDPVDHHVCGEHVREDYFDGEGRRQKDLHWEHHDRGAKEMPLWRWEDLDAAPPGARVIVCEGEKAADAAREAGLRAVGTCTGADTTPCDRTLSILLDFNVILWADADPPDNQHPDGAGQEHMQRIAARLVALGIKTPPRWIEWPEAPEHGDAWEYFGQGNTIGELEALITDLPGGATQEDESRQDSTEPTPEWEEPVPLPDLLPPVPTLPPAIIPEPLRDWIQDGAERIGCPIDFIAAAAIVVASSIVGRAVGIHPKQWDDWVVVPNLWGVLVGRPSTRKSPGLGEAMRGLGAAIADEERRYEAAFAVWVREELNPYLARGDPQGGHARG